METRPWQMTWTSVNPLTRLATLVQVVQSKRDARVKRSHRNRRAAVSAGRRAVLRVQKRWWEPR